MKKAASVLWAVWAIAASLDGLLGADECFAVAPRVLRLGSAETVAVMVGGKGQKVSISLENLPAGRGPFFQTALDVTPGSMGAAQVLVQPADLPELKLAKGEAKVTMKLSCGALWTRQLVLPVSGASTEHLFLQTDKPIYHPGSTVNIRFIALNGSLVPTSTPFKLQVRNPQDVVLEERDFTPDRDIMLSHQFFVPNNTLLGEWKLLMKHGYKNEQNTTTTFAVEKYVLPRFSVQLRTENYILPNFENIACDVTARFVNQQTVRGTVTFRFSVRNDLGLVEKIGTSGKPKQLQAGYAKYVLPRADVASRLGAKLDGLFGTRSRLVVEAIVSEEATGARETASNDNAVFTTTPFVVSVARSETSFKPGAKFYVMADVKYASGEPAKDVKTKLTCDKCQRRTASAKTNDKGVATFYVQSKVGDGALDFKLETDDTIFPAQQQARTVHRMLPYRPTSRKDIIIERKDPKTPLQAGKLYDAVLFHSADVNEMSAYYVVVSRGRVLRAEKVNTAPGVLDRRVTFTVTPEMSPSFRIVVVAMLDGELAVDAVYVRVEPTCTEDSQFSLSRNSQEQSLYPGAEETLVVRGKPGTRVGLLGVDQAVYLLRRKDLLTRDKVFESFQAKDLGSGVDAGTKPGEALAKAGIVLLAAQGVFGNQDNSHRRKREVSFDIVQEYGDDKVLLQCCAKGLQRDQFLRTCAEREKDLRHYLNASSALYTEECVDAYVRCCEHIEDSEVLGKSGGAGIDALGEASFDFNANVRQEFRDTWLFQEITIENDGVGQFTATLPHSITTWEVGAVSVAPGGGICVHEPLKVLVFKKLFLEVNLPYSVIQNEQVEIPVTVYNYDNGERTVRVAMLGTRDVCSGAKEGQPSAVRTVKVPARQGRTVVFPVVPLAAGERLIHVAAVSDASEKDAAKVTLRIERPGEPKRQSLNFILDPKNPGNRPARSINASYTEMFVAQGKQVIQIQRGRRSPQEVVPGSERCEIDIVGDDMGAALEASVKSPESLLRMPSGCGEQTMIGLAPTLYAYEYLKSTDRISPGDEDKALNFIRSGYQRILTFRKTDGSFTVWQNYASSLWLTSFVVRSLCEARKAVNIDEGVITSGLEYILKQQQPDGRFHDIYRLHHTDLLGGVSGPVPLTAYVLLTLQECAKDGIQSAGLDTSSAKATAFIEKELEKCDSPYVVSLAAYALILTGSGPARQAALTRLKSTLQEDQDGLHVQAETVPLSVQATSYALMTLLEAGEGDVTGLVRWLNLRMNPSGSLQSSQDTVVALQALAKYAVYARDAGIDLTCEVTLSGDRNFNRTLRIRRDNAGVKNRIQIPDADGKVFVSVRGSGTAVMYFVREYQAPVEADFLCKFNLSINFDVQKVDVEAALKGRGKLQETHKMNVCARSLAKNIPGMAILEVGLLTGFRPVQQHLEKLVEDKRVDSYELSQRSVVFYLPTIPADAHACVDFGLRQEFAVGKVHSASVKAYAYYDPAISCTKFYSPDNASPLLKIDCTRAGNSDVCTCLEGGCPPENIQELFTKDEDNKLMMTSECRQYIRYHACELVEFVWKGKVLRTSHRDGFITAKFFISKVLKPGIEGEDEILNKTRIFKARDNCHSLKMEEEAEYIIMGMDAKYKEPDEFGEKQFVYVIDSDSVIIPLGQKGRKGKGRGGTSADPPCDFDKLVHWFINEFSREDTRCLS